MFPTIADRVIALDFETTGLHWWDSKAFGVAVYVGGESFYYDLRRTPAAVMWLRDQLPNVKLWINHNIKFDVMFMMNLGVRIPETRLSCTMLRAALIDEHLLSYSLDELGKRYVGMQKDADIYPELASIFGGRPTRNAQMKNLPDAPVDLVARYAKKDAVVAHKLWWWQEAEIDRQGLRRVEALEHALLPVVIRMERAGVRVDEERAEKSIRDLGTIIEKDHRELNSIAGFEVNYNPSGSIKKLFDPKRNADGKWELIDGTISEETEAGAPSIDADCLRRMKHPAASKIMRLRKLTKTRDTFLKGHVLGHAHNGRIHFNINQTKGTNDAGTGTGRLSINDPALQQIPARDKEIKAIVRPCFLPDDGQKWLGIDWSSFEYRVFAHYLNDPEFNERYRKDPDTDFHQVVADLTGIPRNAQYVGGPSAKAVNLSLVFGAGPGKAAEMIGLPYTQDVGHNGRVYLKPGPEAQEMFDKYHTAVPGVKRLLERASSVAKARGHIITAMGRHIRFPGGKATHKAGGLIFQGTSADCMKTKMIEVDAICREHGHSALRLTVHDEIGVSIPEGDDELVGKIVKAYTTFDGMNSLIKLRTPITCEWGVGDNWFEAKG